MYGQAHLQRRGILSPRTISLRLSIQNEPQPQRQHRQRHHGGDVDPEFFRDADLVGGLVEDEEVHSEDGLCGCQGLTSKCPHTTRFSEDWVGMYSRR